MWTKRSFVTVAFVLCYFWLSFVYSAPNSLENDPREMNEVNYDAPASEEIFCTTEKCKAVASEITKFRDLSVNPCEDFYGYVCGSFINSSEIPEDKVAIDQFGLIADDLEKNLKLTFEEMINESSHSPFDMVRRLYDNCMDQCQIEEVGLQDIKNLLKKMGEWPVISETWSSVDFNLQQSMSRLRRAGFNGDFFMTFFVNIDRKKTENYILELDQPALGLVPEYLNEGFHHPDVRAYLDYMIKVAIAFGADNVTAKQEMKEVLKLEMRLASIIVPPEDRRNGSQLYHKMTIEQLTQNYPDFAWIEYMNSYFDPEDDDEIMTSEEIVVVVPEYFRKLMPILKKSSKIALANYVMWRCVDSVVRYLNDDLVKIRQEFDRVIVGQKEDLPRWKKCVRLVTNRLDSAVGSLYVKHFFNPESKSEAHDMMDNIVSQFSNIIDHIDWMDNTTKKIAKDKVKAIKFIIGYPPELLEIDSLTKLFDGLEITGGSLLKNLLNITNYKIHSNFKNLKRSAKDNIWMMYGNTAEVNAFYDPLTNTIFFPAGILQGIFFHKDHPKYINYGAVGYVIGHEITHGFDDEGRQFDLMGNLFNWWDPMTEKNFIKRTKCIIKQYGSIKVPELGLKINGVLTQGENIADNGGIKQAYQAYQHWVHDNKPEKKLASLEYSPNQLFWIQAARVWCSKERDEYLKQTVLTDVHSPSKYRVNVAMSNMKEFSQDWNCPLGSKMHPKKTCSVW